ncbi:unnamed protein product, partial [Sphacelaria rigidula]
RGNSVSRRTQEGRCNSLGCPGGYIPVPNAWEVECGEDCSVELCCQAFCSGYACPSGFIPNPETSQRMCGEGGCNDEQCCMRHAGTDPDGNNLEGPLCNSIGCPGGFIPIEEAWLVECDGDTCTVDQCCVAHGNPPNNPDGPPGPDTPPGPDGGAGTRFCNFIGCPNGYIPIPNAWEVECNGECSVNQCCESFCWGHPCPNGFIPNPETNDRMCGEGGCNDEQCCMRHAGTDPDGNNLEGPLCNR